MPMHTLFYEHALEAMSVGCKDVASHVHTCTHLLPRMKQKAKYN